MNCFHCFETKQTLTDLKVNALVKGSLSFFLKKLFQKKKVTGSVKRRRVKKEQDLFVFRREKNEKVVFFFSVRERK